MENIEMIFSKETSFDNKSILNKFNKKIDQKILDQIEAGITLENLQKLTKNGLPVLKYKTQITVHGLFPELSTNYIFGYKNIFQNKNLSIGIKYNAIDEEKRQRIAKRLKCIGFHYNRNSQGTKFDIMKIVNKDNFETVKNKFLNLKNNIDTSLFCGYYQIYSGQIWGITYLCFDLYINAIYEKNIEPFLNKIGATIELFEAEQRKKEIAEAEYKKEIEQNRIEAEAKKKASQESKKDQIELLNKYPKIEHTNKPGKYILKQFDYENNLIFKVVYIYLIKGKQKPRWNKKSFDNINDALNYNPIENWSDSIYSSKLTGHLIN